MKPDWKDAPEWAKWLSMDEDGNWTWFENEPIIFVDSWITEYGKKIIASELPYFRETKEKRPK